MVVRITVSPQCCVFLAIVQHTYHIDWEFVTYLHVTAFLEQKQYSEFFYIFMTVYCTSFLIFSCVAHRLFSFLFRTSRHLATALPRATCNIYWFKFKFHVKWTEKSKEIVLGINVTCSLCQHEKCNDCSLGLEQASPLDMPLTLSCNSKQRTWCIKYRENETKKCNEVFDFECNGT